MKRQLGPIVVVLVLLCVPAWSQNGSGDSTDTSSASSTPASSADSSSSVSSSPDASSPASTLYSATDPYYQSTTGDSGQSGTDDQTDNSQSPSTTQSRFAHPEQLPPLPAIAEAANHTGIGLSLSTGSLSDYVWHPNNGGASYWQNIALFNAGLSIGQERPTSAWYLAYSGGVTSSSLSTATGGTYLNLNQSARANIIWNMASHWQMRIKDTYSYTDNPFEPFLTYIGDPTPNYPNPVAYFPQAVYEQNQGSVDLTYQLNSHDAINFAFYQGLNHYLRSSSQALWNSFSYTESATYQHRFSDRLSAGGGYAFTALDFGHGQSRAGVQTFETFIVYKIRRGFTVSGWIGPQLTHTKDIVPVFCSPYGCFVEVQHLSKFNTAEGGSINYQKGSNVVRIQGSDRITDGGGILGATTLYQATIAYSRPINRAWGFGAAVMYDNSKSIAFNRNQYWSATQGTVSVNHKFVSGLSGAAYLLFIHQNQNFYGTPGTTSTAGLGLSLHYGWGRSLGW